MSYHYVFLQVTVISRCIITVDTFPGPGLCAAVVIITPHCSGGSVVLLHLTLAFDVHFHRELGCCSEATMVTDYLRELQILLVFGILLKYSMLHSHVVHIRILPGGIKGTLVALKDLFCVLSISVGVQIWQIVAFIRASITFKKCFIGMYGFHVGNQFLSAGDKNTELAFRWCDV